MPTQRYRELVETVSRNLRRMARTGTFQSVPAIGFDPPPTTPADLQRLRWVRQKVSTCTLCPLAELRDKRGRETAEMKLRKIAMAHGARGLTLDEVMEGQRQQGQDPQWVYERFARVVPGTGPLNARVMVVGEAPGFYEEQTSEAQWIRSLGMDPQSVEFAGSPRFGAPFVGPSGWLLDRMLEFAGLRRHEVYVLNTVACRPPENRDPATEEWRACSHGVTEGGEVKGAYTRRQISAIRPWLIIGMGRLAAKVLVGQDGGVAACRGRVFDYPMSSRLGVPIKVVITYHPAMLLRKRPMMMAVADDDWSLIRAMLTQARARFPNVWPAAPVYENADESANESDGDV